MKGSESDLEGINRILTFCLCCRFSTMKMIHLWERKASKEFAPMLQMEPHVMILWRRTYVIHYFCLHKENLVYDVASDIGGGQSRLETGVARHCSPSWAVLAADEALSLGSNVHIPNIFIFTIGPGRNSWTQEPRRYVDSFSAHRGFSSSHFMGRFVDLKDKI